MKRIFFTQQRPFDYMPLRAGLGLITEAELERYMVLRFLAPGVLRPKIYTTRTHPLHGEYYVVEGSRFKAKPVEPEIKFRVSQSCELNLRDALVLTGNTCAGKKGKEVKEALLQHRILVHSLYFSQSHVKDQLSSYTRRCETAWRAKMINEMDGKLWATTAILDRNDRTFPELDLGIRGSTFEQLRDELLRLNKKATIDTPFFVNRLERIS